jgi:hypothetical protein
MWNHWCNVSSSWQMLSIENSHMILSIPSISAIPHPHGVSIPFPCKFSSLSSHFSSTFIQTIWKPHLDWIKGITPTPFSSIFKSIVGVYCRESISKCIIPIILLKCEVWNLLGAYKYYSKTRRKDFLYTYLFTLTQWRKGKNLQRANEIYL